MMRFSTLQNMTTMVSGLLSSSIRSMLTLIPRSVKLYRTPTMAILMMMIIMLSFITSPINTSTVTNEDGCIIQQHDIVVDEPIIHSIDHWKNDKQQQQEEDQNEGMKHRNDIMMMMLKEIAVIHYHRMTQTCINTETELQNAVNAAKSPFSSTTPTIINICANIILYMTTEIYLYNKFIQFNCEFNVDKCTLDAQAKSRHFRIGFSNITFQQLVFKNGKVSGNSTSGGSLDIFDSTVDIMYCKFFYK